ncbi:MAG TPA: DUF2690 domain-containing protein [Mycobacteriales bacterium]|nr:DUF2690 domain-containing protein [Mycobacteriales bacterium]
MGSAPQVSGRWRPLPDSLDPDVAYLVGLLRELKDRSGLSLAALAVRTAYSKSSWERYLNGTALPPGHAVEALGRLAGEPADRLLALWERAEARWSGRAARARPAVHSPRPAAADRDREPDPPPPHGRPRALVALVALAVLVACGVVVGLVALAGPGGVPGTSAPTGPPSSAAPLPLTVGCDGVRCAGEDPRDTACAVDATSSAELRVGNADLELRTSDQCAAAWARVSHATAGTQVQVVDQDGRTETVTIAGTAAEGYVHTPMIPADRHVPMRACLKPFHGNLHCTPWRATA